MVQMDEWKPSEFAFKLFGYHESGWWNDEMIWNAYRKGRITKEELEWILGTGNLTTP